MAKSLKKRQSHIVGLKRVSKDRAFTGAKNIEVISKIAYESKK
jgi:hypothetical protein